MSKDFVEFSLHGPEVIVFVLSTQGGLHEAIVGFSYLMILKKMLRNLLCSVENHLFLCLKRSRSTPWTGFCIYWAPHWWVMKKHIIYRRKGRTYTASVIFPVLVLCSHDLISLLIMQILVPPFLGTTATIVVTWFQWLGNHYFPVTSVFQCLFLDRVHWFLSVPSFVIKKNLFFHPPGCQLGIHGPWLRPPNIHSVILYPCTFLIPCKKRLDPRGEDEVCFRYPRAAYRNILQILSTDVYPKLIWGDSFYIVMCLL